MESIEICDINGVSYVIHISKLTKNIIINPPPKNKIVNKVIAQKIRGSENTVVITLDYLEPKIAETWFDSPILVNEKIAEDSPNIVKTKINEVNWIDNENAIAILEHNNLFIKTGGIKILYIYKNIQEQEEPNYIDIVILTKNSTIKENISAKKLYPQILIQSQKLPLREGSCITIKRHLTQLHIKH